MSVLGYKVTFNNKQREFFNALKQEVDSYFEKNGISKTGNWKLYTKTLILIPSAIAIYLTLMMVSLHWSVSSLLWVIFGLNMAAIGFNIMHDAVMEVSQLEDGLMNYSDLPITSWVEMRFYGN